MLWNSSIKKLVSNVANQQMTQLKSLYITGSRQKSSTMIPVLRKVSQLNTMHRKNGGPITNVCTRAPNVEVTALADNIVRLAIQRLRIHNCNFNDGLVPTN